MPPTLAPTGCLDGIACPHTPTPCIPRPCAVQARCRPHLKPRHLPSRPNKRAEVLKDMPIWAFHGINDEVLPVSLSDISPVHPARALPRAPAPSQPEPALTPSPAACTHTHVRAPIPTPTWHAACLTSWARASQSMTGRNLADLERLAEVTNGRLATSRVEAPS